jgi:hypothetical protein
MPDPMTNPAPSTMNPVIGMLIGTRRRGWGGPPSSLPARLQASDDDRHLDRAEQPIVVLPREPQVGHGRPDGDGESQLPSVAEVVRNL